MLSMSATLSCTSKLWACLNNIVLKQIIAMMLSTHNITLGCSLTINTTIAYEMLADVVCQDLKNTELDQKEKGNMR